MSRGFFKRKQSASHALLTTRARRKARAKNFLLVADAAGMCAATTFVFFTCGQARFLARSYENTRVKLHRVGF
jgi:hypothetical protein